MPPKRRNPNWKKSASNEITDFMQSGIDVFENSQEKKVKAVEKSAKRVSSVIKAQLKEQAKQQKDHLHNIGDQVRKEHEQISKSEQAWLSGLTKNLNAAFRLTQDHAKKLLGLGTEFQRKMPQGKNNIFGSFGEGAGVAGRSVVQAAGNELKEIAGYLKSMVPAITAIGGPALLLAGIFDRVFQTQKASSDLLKSSGGDFMGLTSFNLSLGRLSNNLRIDQDDLRELGKAFTEVGVPVSHLNTKVLEFIDASAGGIRMFGLSNDIAAKYTRTLAMQGMGMDAIKGHWDQITQQMFSFNGTVSDANDSIIEGIDAWEQYGAAVGANITGFQKGILETKGLFKSLNMDAKSASRVLGSVFGDMFKRRRQAAFLTSIGGGDPYATLNLLSDPSRAKEATQLRMTRGLQLMQKMMGSDAQYLQGDFNSISDQKKQAMVRLRYDLARKRLEGLDFDSAMMDGVLAQFRNYKGSASSFIPDMMKMQGSGKPRASMQETLEELNKTMPEIISKLQRTLENMLSEMANNLIPRIRDTITAIDNVATEISLLTPILGQIAGYVADVLNLFGKAVSKPVGKTLNYLSNGSVNLSGTNSMPKAGIFGPGLSNLLRWGGDGARAVMDSNAAGIHKALHGSTGQGVVNSTQGSFLMNYLKNSSPLKSFSGGAYGKEDWGSRATTDFKRKTVEVANRLGMNPDHLMAVMMFESGLNPAISNKYSGATGLIQFMNAAGVGTTKSALKKMSGVQQLDYVEKYLSPYKGKMKNMQDAYMAVFSPAFIGSSAGTGMYKSGSLAYGQNKGLDINKDGVITVGEAASLPASKLAKFKSLSKDPSIYPNLNSNAGVLSTANSDSAKMQQIANKVVTLLEEGNKIRNQQAQMAAAQVDQQRYQVKGNVISSQYTAAAAKGQI